MNIYSIDYNCKEYQIWTLAQMFWDLDKVVYIMKKKAISFQIKLKLYYILNYLHLVDADFWMEYIRPLKRKFFVVGQWIQYNRFVFKI